MVLRLCCPVVVTVTRKGNIRIYTYIYIHRATSMQCNCNCPHMLHGIFSHIHPQLSLKSQMHILVDVPAPMEQLQMPPRTRTMALKTPFSPSEFRWGILQCSSDCRAVTRLQRVPDLDPVAFFFQYPWPPPHQIWPKIWYSTSILGS